MVTGLLDIDGAEARLAAAPPEAILRWAIDHIPRFAVSSSFGTDSAALLHVLAEVDPTVPVLFLDTGFHFPETLTYRQELSAALGLRDVRDIRPRLTVEGQAARYGPALYARDPDRCCAMRKVAPLDEALADFDGWASGVRRDQTLDRAGVPVVGTARRANRTLVKVAPLAAWALADVDAYLAVHGLPRHPLEGAGYTSIGCAPCTRPVRQGEHPRAGRWPDSLKTECGIHLDDDTTR